MRFMELLEQIFQHYGYLVLLIGLPLDFIALPLPPGNSTLTYSGYLAYKQVLEVVPTLCFAIVGAIIGVTVTYFIGYTLGMPFIERYGRWLYIKPSFMEKTGRYFNKYGTNLLIISFFIPGIRQFIGYFIGIIRMPFRSVFLYAYSGVALWAFTFFSIGYFFGKQWERVFNMVEQYLTYFFIVLACAMLSFLLVKWKRYLRKKNSA